MADLPSNESESFGGSQLDKQAATVAIIFAVLSGLGGILGQNAANSAAQLQGQANLRKVEMADQWAYHQARTTKLAVYRTHQDLLQAIKPGAQVKAEYLESMQEYERERKEITGRAAALQKQADDDAHAAEFKMRQNDRFDLSVGLLQVATAVASLTVLGKKRWMLGTGILIGLVGFFLSVSAVLMKPAV